MQRFYFFDSLFSKPPSPIKKINSMKLKNLFSALLLISLFTLTLSAQCSITDVFAEAYNCNDQGQIFVDIEFDIDNPGASNQFTINGNGTSYGTFEYGQTFYTVGPFIPNCDLEYEFVITDVDDNECSGFYVFNDVLCCEEGECAITTLDFGPNPVCVDGLIVTEWLIDGENLSEVGFDIYINDVFETYVEWNNDSWYDFDIVDSGLENFVLKVCDNDNADCCILLDVENPCYDENENEECAIINLGAEAYDCNEDGEIYFDIFFDVENPGADNQFTVVGNGNSYGTFNYGEDYYTVGPFIADCETAVELIVTDVNNNDCSAFTGFDEIFCCEEGECAITTLDFGPNPECVDGFIVTEWLIDGENLSEVGFDIFINNVFETYVEWNNDAWYDFDIEDPGTVVFTIKVCDNDNEDCCIEWELENPCYDGNEECSISEVAVEQQDCNDNGFAFFHLTFEYDNVGDDNQFTVVGNGNDYGTFEYGADFYEIGPIESNCDLELEFIVTDVNLNECSEYAGYGPLCCDENTACSISEASVEQQECIDGVAFFHLTFEYNNVGDDNQFTVVGNGNDYGTFEYGALFYEIGPIESNCDLELEFIVTDVNLNDCSASIGSGPLCCDENSDCNIAGLVVEQQECNDGVAFFHLSFDYENTGDGNQFTVVGNGNDYGTFEYGASFYEIGPIESNCDLELEFIVTDVNLNDCSASIGSGPLCCDENTECDITELNVDCTSCSDNNTCGFFLDFEIINDSEVSFDLFIENEFYDSYGYDDLPLEVEGLSSDSQWITVKVCDNDNEECCAIIEFLNPCYEGSGEECSITEVSAEFIECDENGEAYFHITFDYNNVGDENQFTITGNGENYGTFEYGLEFYSVGPVIANCETELEFIVTDVNNNDCSAFVGHDPACCGDDPDCALLELSLETTECLDDNTFDLTIDVEVDGEINDFFDLFIEEEFIGFYEFAALPLVIEGLAYDDELITIELCENDNPDCCLLINILNPCTEEGNQQYFINEMEYELVFCEENMITMMLDFSYGDNNDQFQINSNGISFGTFSYNDLPIMVENIPADGVTDYTFTISDTMIDDLLNSIHVGTLACDGDVILNSDDITLDPANIKSIKAYDITGKLLGLFDSEESLRILDVDRSLLAGLIILRIDYGTQIVTKKIVRVN